MDHPYPYGSPVRHLNQVWAGPGEVTAYVKGLGPDSSDYEVFAGVDFSKPLGPSNLPVRVTWWSGPCTIAVTQEEELGMARSVEPGQTFVECGVFTDRMPRRVRVKAVFPDGAEWVPSGMAFITSVREQAGVELEVRLRAIKLSSLYLTGSTFRGLPRRGGYVLESSFPGWAAVRGFGPLLHASRAVASDDFSDVYTTACGMTGRWMAAQAQALQCGVCLDALAEWNRVGL
jgi:hypothetical protein